MTAQGSARAYVLGRALAQLMQSEGHNYDPATMSDAFESGYRFYQEYVHSTTTDDPPLMSPLDPEQIAALERVF